MEALALSEFYGFARLGFVPEDITVSEEELQRRYSSDRMRVPEFVAGDQMVEVKRLKLDFDIGDIVKKACEKAHLELVCNERVHTFHICYALPLSSTQIHIRKMQKMVKMYTFEYANLIHVKTVNVVFTRVPDVCFSF